MNKNVRNKKTKQITTAAILCAVSTVLSQIRFFRFIRGGSINFGPLPILIGSICYGPSLGIGVGLVAAMIKLLTTNLYHPASAFLDYILPYIFIGSCGIGIKNSNNTKRTKHTIQICLNISLSFILKYFSHVVGGATIFKEYAPKDQNPWIYSFALNAYYVLPTFVINTIIVLLILKTRERTKIEPHQS